VGSPQPLSFEIEREKIAVDPVSYFGMLENGIGYIKLNSFTINSAADVKKALVNLRTNNQLSGLVLDLRDNGGGLLTEAVSIVNLFVKKNELVVSTKGKQKDKNHSYRTTSDPVEPDLPLAVLVNGMSASASEIVAGALQDLDRAVIIGKRTFGKGLVQNSFPLMYNTQVKVTVAKYYIPSGRCIQEIDYAHKNADGDVGNIPDSLITAFKTLNGRTVYDGKGILPDVQTDTNQISTITFNLITQYLIFDFATQYVSRKPSIDPARSFKLTDSEYDDFVAFTKSKNFDYKTVTSAELEKLKQAAEFEKNWDEIKPLYDSMQATLAAGKNSDLLKHKTEISEILQEEIASRYYYQKGRIEAGLSYDTDLLKTIQVLTDRATYSSVLNGSYKADNKTSSPGQN
jgi:carboxyl-terminal processing protease